MKKTENISLANGVSFHNVTIKVTPNQIIEVLGDPSYVDNTGSDKVNMDWICETDNGEVFTIYDWKEYTPLEYDKPYVFHIGAHSKGVSERAKMEFATTLMALPLKIN